jgi:3,5-dihydroxyphenylacetyl-CoA synthase
MGLPQGTVTFLFTDWEGPARLRETRPPDMPDALTRHDTIVRGAVESHGGVVFSTTGDGMAAVFASARAAVLAVLAAQAELTGEDCSEVTGPLAARIGLLTDGGVLGGEHHLNQPLNRRARLVAAGNGGQAPISGTTELLVRNDMPDGCGLLDLGEHRLRDLARPVRIFQLTAPGLRNGYALRLDRIEAHLIRRPAPLRERAAAIASVGSAFPEASHSQEEIGALLGLGNRVVTKLLRAPHIQKRHLYLPEKDARTGRALPESATDLHTKFRDGALEIGSRAIRSALDAVSLSPADVDYMLCVTSSGFMVPGLSALFSRELGFDRRLRRADIVGMGCNAGLNGLNPLVQWARNHPGRVALLVCCEINSAMYVRDDTVRTGIVNSLFGDGAAAAVLTSYPGNGHGIPRSRPVPCVLDFESFCIPEQWSSMRFDWNDDAGKWSFYLDRDLPYVIGFNVREPVERLLERNGLDFSDIRHWILHTGGGAVIDSVKLSLGLEEHDVRHTRSVLRDYGNISSGSFLVSLERLLAEGCAAAGDRGVMVTMGPGAQIETALLHFGQAATC